MQKGQIQIILIGILIVVMVAAGAYYLGRSTTSKPLPPVSPAPQPTQDASRESTGFAETTNWKGFVSIDHDDSYSIKYPPSWSLVELSPSSIEIYDQPNITQPRLHDGTQLSIFTDDKWEGPLVEDPVGTRRQYVPGIYGEKVADIWLDNRRAAKMIPVPSKSLEAQFIFIISRLNDKFFILSFSSINQEQLNKDSVIFDKILQTFKFLK